MQNKQLNVISGFPLDDVVLSSSSKYEEVRLPYVGQKVEFDDGRCYRFCSTQEVFVAGEMVGVATAASAEFDGKLTAASIGANTLILDITNIAVLGQSASVMAKDIMAGGYIMLTDDAGEGYSYRIKSNSIQDASAKVTFTLYDAIKVAATTATDCCLVGPKYRNVVEAAVTAECPIGAALVPTTGASSTVTAYFWAQTKGPGIALGAGTLGAPLKLSTGGALADSAEAGSGVYDVICGYALATTANGYVPCDFILE